MKLRNKKTGEIGELICNPSIYNMYFVANDNGNASYSSLAELNKEWEDYDPEPLIEDEKIRRAVRAWAEVNELTDEDTVEVSAPTIDLSVLELTHGFMRISIFAETKLKKDKRYSIAELCGEEEE